LDKDEVAAALRLLHRVHKHYPRAFDVVLADGLYARISFLRAVRALGKDLVAVLKNDRWTLTQEVQALCNEVPPTEHLAERTTRLYARNLKPAVRRRATLQHVGRQISADLHVCAFAPT